MFIGSMHVPNMRWREEVTLTGYEMHWVVRYLLNKSRTWDHLISGTGTSTGTPTSSVGIIAYARQKQQTWTIWPTVLIVYLPQ